MEWGLDKVFFYVLVLVLVIILIVYSADNFMGFSKKTVEEKTTPVEIKKDNNTIDTYEELEDSVEKAARSYINKNYPNLSIGDNFIIMTDSLISGDYIKTINDIKDKSLSCIGYVNVYNDGTAISYKSYIKCGNKYTTKGYVTRYMEKL